jgi:transcriptional regulator with XRE-family HTH domain
VINVSLGQRLKKLRGKQSQEDFAKGIGISRSRYSHYELDTVEPDINTLTKIADIHNVSIDHLLGIDSQPSTVEEERAFYDAMQDDPDDEFFVEGYLKATDEEKKMVRKFWRDHIWKKRR